MQTALYFAAFLVVAVGIAHSYLGERYILIRLFRHEDLPKLFGSTEFTILTLRFAWQCYRPRDRLHLPRPLCHCACRISWQTLVLASIPRHWNDRHLCNPRLNRGVRTHDAKRGTRSRARSSRPT